MRAYISAPSPGALSSPLARVRSVKRSTSAACVDAVDLLGGVAQRAGPREVEMRTLAGLDRRNGWEGQWFEVGAAGVAVHIDDPQPRDGAGDDRHAREGPLRIPRADRRFVGWRALEILPLDEGLFRGRVGRDNRPSEVLPVREGGGEDGRCVRGLGWRGVW